MNSQDILHRRCLPKNLINLSRILIKKKSIPEIKIISYKSFQKDPGLVVVLHDFKSTNHSKLYLLVLEIDLSLLNFFPYFQGYRKKVSTFGRFCRPFFFLF